MLPVTQAEVEPSTTPFDSAVQVDLDPWSKQEASLPANSLNIDLDFSKVTPPAPRVVPSNNHVEFYTDGEHEKAVATPEDAQTRKPLITAKSLPKSVQKLKKPIQAPTLATDQKSNLIDFESFANPPVPQKPSRFTG